MKFSSSFPAWGLEQVKKRIAKHEKRIKSKINIVSISKPYPKVVPARGIHTGTGLTEIMDFIDMELDVPEIDYVISGYRVVALVDYTKLLDSNKGIVHLFDKNFKDIAEEYRDGEKSHCDHCKTNRYRSKIFLVHNEETDDLKVIGSSCLKDFLKIDRNPMSLFCVEETLLGAIEDDLFKIDSVNIKYRYYSIADILGVAYHYIQKHGYLSRKKSIESGKTPTSERIFDHIFVVSGEPKDEITEEEKSKGKEIFNWIVEKKDIALDDSEFSNNIKAAIEVGHVNYTLFGTVAYIVSLWQRLSNLSDDEIILKGRVVKKNSSEAKSQYVGTIGERRDFSLKYKSSNSFEGMFGLKFVHNFEDEDGNKFVWFTGKAIKVDPAKFVKITGTIQNHGDYNGVKQTIITRCKVYA